MLDKLSLLAIRIAADPTGTGGGSTGTGGTTGQGINIPSGIPNPTGTDGVTFTSLITGIINWGLSVAGGVAVLILIVGGFLYLTAAGNQERIEKAKKTIKGAIIGIIIILLSAIIVITIGKILSPPTGSSF